MVNKVILVGNLGADPEVRNAKSGTTVARLRVATTTRRKDADGEWADATEWHTVTTFGKLAENCSRFLTKGRSVYVEGRLETQQYEKDGQTRYSTVVIAEDVKFLGGGDRARDDESPSEEGF